jgi:hypothetical protein
MATTHSQVSIDAAVLAMLELPLGARRAARDAIAVILLRQVSKMARSWFRAGGSPENVELEDIEGQGALFYLEALEEIALGTVPQTGVRDWGAYLATRVNFRIAAWLKSPTVTGTPGSQVTERRAVHGRHVIQRFHAAHGREPSAQELVVASNAEMNARRSNARKQGALLPLAEARAILGEWAPISIPAPRMSFA